MTQLPTEPDVEGFGSYPAATSDGGRGFDSHSQSAGRRHPVEAPQDPAARPRSIWITLEGPDIIELKQIVLDRDAVGAIDFFQRVILPQVRKAARQRGIITDEDVRDEINGSLSG